MFVLIVAELRCVIFDWLHITSKHEMRHKQTDEVCLSSYLTCVSSHLMTYDASATRLAPHHKLIAILWWNAEPYA